MAIEMNFGWLNDYTGSKFAPVTLANLVLLNTSSGSTETLYDYIQSEHSSFRATLQSQSKTLGQHDEMFTRLLSIVPKDAGGKEIKPAAVQRAGRLVAVDDGGDVDWINRANKEIGISKGSKQLPVYFADGIPAECYTAKVVTMDYKYPNIDNATNSYDQSKMLKKTVYTFGKIGDGSSGENQYLNANIKGVAQYAIESHTAVECEFADTAEKAKVAYTANQMAYDINIGYNSNDKQEGNVVGVIDTNGGTTKNGKLNAVLSLYDIDTIAAGTFGGDVQQDTTTFNIPKITVNKKGLVTKVENLPITPKVAVTPYQSATGNTAALVGWMGNSNSPTFIGASTDTTNGIYMDWSVSPPVLMGAAWNDYAEYRAQIDDIEPGYCVKSNDDGRVERTNEHMSICDGIVSDTFGFSIGKSDKYRTPLAVSGRVLAYCEGNREDYHAGDVVCASENGKVIKMTREEIKEYPDRIVGTVSEIPQYEKWNEKLINNRIWIKVK